jgi:hypothetical protein
MRKTVLIAAGIVLLGSPGAAPAQQANQIGTFKQWNAYSHSDANGKVCYAASQPQDSKYSSDVKSRDPVFFMITTRPSANVRNEVSTIIGYPFKAESKVTVDVDGKKFTMFTQNDGAWMEDASQESGLIEAMRAGSKMTVSGVSRRGTQTTDMYSLSGITAALEAVGKECP